MRSRAKIVDATLRVIADSGFDAVTIAAVSLEAGVSRQTVYSIFGSRDVLVTRAMEELALSVFTDIRSKLGTPATVRDYVVEMIVASRRAVRDHPALAALLSTEATNPVLHPDVVQHAAPIVRELLSPVVDVQPDAALVVDDIVQISTRLGISVVLFDDPAITGDDDLRAFLMRWLPTTMNIPTRRP